MQRQIVALNDQMKLRHLRRVTRLQRRKVTSSLPLASSVVVACSTCPTILSLSPTPASYTFNKLFPSSQPWDFVFSSLQQVSMAHGGGFPDVGRKRDRLHAHCRGLYPTSGWFPNPNSLRIGTEPRYFFYGFIPSLASQPKTPARPVEYLSCEVYTSVFDFPREIKGLSPTFPYIRTQSFFFPPC